MLRADSVSNIVFGETVVKQGTGILGTTISPDESNVVPTSFSLQGFSVMFGQYS